LPGLAWIKDLQGRYVFVNEAAEEAFGVPRAQLYGMTDDDIFPPEVAAQFKENDRRALTSAAGVETVETLLQSDGRVHHSLVSKFALASPEGRPLLIGGVAVDITRRMQAEHTARNVSDFREAVIRTAAEGICVCRAIEEFPYVAFSVWNDQMCELTGYTMEEINRLGWYQSLYPDPDVRAAAIERMANMREGNDMRSEEWTIVRKDGQRRTLAISTSLVELSEGQGAVVALMHDVTDHIRDAERLRMSEARMRSLFDVIPDLIFRLDADRVIVDIGAAATSDLLAPPETIIGRRHRDVIPPAVADQFDQAAELAGKLSCVQSFDYALDLPDGRRQHFEARVAVLEDGGAVVAVRNVTARRQAEEALKQSERKYRDLVETAHDLIWSVDAQGCWTFLNRSGALAIYGYEPEEMLGRPFTDFMTAEQSAKDMAAFADIKQGAPVIQYETEHIRKDGSRAVLSFNAIPLYGPDGESLGTTGTATDITKRKQAEEELREGRERLRLAAEATHLGAWDWDIATDAVVFSPEWKRQLGYEDHELPSRFEEWESRLHEDDRAAVLKRLEAYLEGKSPEYAVEFRLRHRDGSYRWIYTRGVALRDDQGRPRRLLGCHVDITERKQAEEILRQ
ncbi:MAG: PAS domain S-box protein, partial [Planctomycetales bacterium]|nr:PAS domain S-box protein [Planctomycetales bacterium]